MLFGPRLQDCVDLFLFHEILSLRRKPVCNIAVFAGDVHKTHVGVMLRKVFGEHIDVMAGKFENKHFELLRAAIIEIVEEEKEKWRMYCKKVSIWFGLLTVLVLTNRNNLMYSYNK